MLGKYSEVLRKLTTSIEPQLPNSPFRRIMPGTPRKELSANLDLLRTIAVMSVFFDHLLGVLHNPSFGSLGRFGVIIFFVHTSFVLMGSLHRLEKTAGSDHALAIGFWIKRIFRIYPLSIVLVVSIVAFHIPAAPDQIYLWSGWRVFLSNLALSQNLVYCNNLLTPLWSLPLEVQMYFLLPFAYFVIRGKPRYRSLALWLLSVLLALTIPRKILPLSVFLYAPCFISGIVAYDLIRSKRWTWKLPAWVWPIGIFVLIALFGPHDNIAIWHKMHRAWGLSLLLGVLYANVEEMPSNWMHQIFHWIADRSYGIYLSHKVVFWIVLYRMEQFPLWVKLPALIAGSIGIPALLYTFLERPLIQVGSRLAKRYLESSAIRKTYDPA